MMHGRRLSCGVLLALILPGWNVLQPRQEGATGGAPVGADTPMVAAGGLELGWQSVVMRGDRELQARDPGWPEPPQGGPQNALEAERLGWWLFYMRGSVREPHRTVPFFVEQRAEVRVLADEEGRDLLGSALPVTLVPMRMPGETRYPLPLRWRGEGLARSSEAVEIAYRLPALPRRFSEVSGVVHATKIVAWTTVDVPVVATEEPDEQVNGFTFRVVSVAPHDDPGERERRMRYEFRIEPPAGGWEEDVPFVASLEFLDKEERALGAVDIRNEGGAGPVVEDGGAVVLRGGYADFHERGGVKVSLVRVYVVTDVEKVEIPFVIRDLRGAGE